MLRLEKWPCSTQEETAGALGEEYGHPSLEATVELMRLALTELNQTATGGPLLLLQDPPRLRAAWPRAPSCGHSIPVARPFTQEML